MIFTLNISNPQSELLFSDVFNMNNEAEVTSRFKFLNENQTNKEYQKGYSLEIKSQDKSLIEVSTNSITTIQDLKTKIYDVLIEKVVVNSPYSSPELKQSNTKRNIT